MDAGFILMMILFAVLVAAVILYGVWAARKRREEMAMLAARLGLRFDPEPNCTLARQFEFLDKLAEGSNRYAFNVLAGEYEGHPVWVFDYHYETYSSSSKGGRQTHHHYFSCFVVRLTRRFPELTIAREGVLSKIARRSATTTLISSLPSFRGRSACARATSGSRTMCATRG